MIGMEDEFVGNKIFSKYRFLRLFNVQIQNDWYHFYTKKSAPQSYIVAMF